MMFLISCDTSKFWTTHTDRISIISITFNILSNIISVKEFGKLTHNIDEALVPMPFGVKYVACKKLGCPKVENEGSVELKVECNLRTHAFYCAADGTIVQCSRVQQDEVEGEEVEYD